MAGFMDILGTLVQQGMASSAPKRMGNLFGMDQPSHSPVDILSQLGGMFGGGSGFGSSPQSGGLGGILGEVLGSLGGNQSALGGIASLAEALFGGRRAGASNHRAVGSGILAMLASLAITALRKAGQRPAAMPQSLLEPKTEADWAALENEAKIIVKAMISAAKADGRIDDAELKKILGKLEEDGLTEEEKQFLIEEANKPLDINEIIQLANNRPELAAQIYAASLMTIEVDTPAEREYMQRLAQGLGLDPQVVEHIHQLLGVSN